MRNKKDIFIAFIITVFMVIGSFDTPVPTEVEEPTEDIIHWKQERTIEEVAVEPLKIEPVAAPTLESLGEYRLTAYCSCEKCCGPYASDRPVDDFGNELVIGASGSLLEAGRSVAVDPSFIPYGTILIINGHEYIASDCGGAIKGNRIDIFMDSHSDALEFGVQYAEVFVKGGVENGMD